MDERTTTDASTTQGSGAPRLDLRSGAQRTFAHVLVNALLVSVVNYTLWFAVTFWVYLETRSVFATGLIAGIFLVAWADRRSGTGLDVYGARVDDAGALLDGAGFGIATGPLPESRVAVSNGVGADLNVVWSRNRLINPVDEGAMFLRAVSPK